MEQKNSVLVGMHVVYGVIGSLSKSLRLALIRLLEVDFSKNETLRMSVGYAQS